MLKHYVALLKYFLRLGHEDVHLNYPLKLKKQFRVWVIIFLLPNTWPSQWCGTKLRPQMSGLLNNPVVQPLWSLSLQEAHFTSMAASGRPRTPTLTSSALSLPTVHPIAPGQRQLSITPPQSIPSYTLWGFLTTSPSKESTECYENPQMTTSRGWGVITGR